MQDRFDKYEGEFLKFERVENRLASRPDLHAFMLLSQLSPGDKDVLASAEHDKVWLSFDPSEVLKTVTDDQIRDLVRCGVMLDEDNDAFHMFV